VPTSQCHFLNDKSTAYTTVKEKNKEFEGGGNYAITEEPIQKSLFFVTDAHGVNKCEINGTTPIEFWAQKPAQAAQKAFYTWHRLHHIDANFNHTVKISSQLKEWLQTLENVTRIQKNVFLDRMSTIAITEISFALEVFIAREGKKPKRYVCYQRLNMQPNAHQVKTLIVIESHAQPCPQGIPSNFEKLGIKQLLKINNN
jgi:hypothetical protein